MKRVNLKKVVGILGVVALLLSVEFYSIAMAEEPTQKPVLPEQAKGKEPKLIWQKEFDEKIIDMAVGHKEIEKVVMKEGKEVKVKEEILYPKVVVTKKAIKFLDEEGRVKKERPLKTLGYATFSPNKKCVGIYGMFKEGDNTIEDFSITDNEGKVLWEFKKEYPGYIHMEEGGRVLHISDKGRVVASELEVIEFFDEKGKLLKKFSISKTGAFPLYFNGVFSEDGEYFVGVPGGDIPKDTSRLFLFDKNGNKLWEKHLEERIEDHCKEVKITKHGDFIIAWKVLFGKGIFVDAFNKEGELVWEYQLKPGGECIFTLSKDEQYLLAGHSKNQLILFKLKDGKVLWSFSDTTREGVYFNIGPLVISQNNKYILASGFTVISKPYQTPILNQYIYLLDFNGNLIWQKYLGESEGYVNVTSANFTPDEKGFSFAMGDKIYHYAIQEGR